MSIVTFRKKPFELVEQYNEYSSHVSFKGKDYFLVTFPTPEEFMNFSYTVRKIYNSGVVSPKFVKEDKNTLQVLLTYVRGVKPIDILLHEPLEEKVFELLYRNNFMARINRLQLDFDPSKWIYSKEEGKLYYVGYDFSEAKDKEYAINVGVRYWYYTREFREYCDNRGLKYDETLFKSEFETNKAILLVACKYFK